MIYFDEIKKALKEYLDKNSIYAPFVTTVATNQKYPKVVIEKVDDRELESDIQRLNIFSIINIELNIYAKDMTQGTKTLSGRTVATEIEENIKMFMGNICGFKRTLDKPTPNIDTSIYRITMRYQIKVSDTRKYIL